MKTANSPKKKAAAEVNAAAEALPIRPPTADVQRLTGQLEALGLSFAAEALPEALTQATKQDLGPPAFLEHLLEAEQSSREERRVRRALRLSGLPTGQTLSNLRLAFQPSVERSRIETLATCSWVQEHRSLLILGPPGVGKTHLAFRPGRSSRGMRLLGGVLPDRGAAARDASRRGVGAVAAEAEEVHEVGAVDRRRDGL